jgi:hypothetical protein
LPIRRLQELACHSRESGNPEPFSASRQEKDESRWIPAFAGMTNTCRSATVRTVRFQIHQSISIPAGCIGGDFFIPCIGIERREPLAKTRQFFGFQVRDLFPDGFYFSRLEILSGLKTDV